VFTERSSKKDIKNRVHSKKQNLSFTDTKSQYTKQRDQLLVMDQEEQKTKSIHPPHPGVLH
jgi:hypothetical protein